MVPVINHLDFTTTRVLVFYDHLLMNKYAKGPCIILIVFTLNSFLKTVVAFNGAKAGTVVASSTFVSSWVTFFL